MALQVYIYQASMVNPTQLSQFLPPATVFTINEPFSAALVAITVDDAVEDDLDAAMADFGYSRVSKLNPGDPLPAATTRPCELAAAVGDLVFFDPVSLQYERALSSSIGPVVGFITAKPTTTSAIVFNSGEIDDILDDAGAALVPGVAYYISSLVSGRVTATATAQRVGVATATDALLFASEPGSPSQGSSGDNLARTMWLWA